jgi:hypothetical protein
MPMARDSMVEAYSAEPRELPRRIAAGSAGRRAAVVACLFAASTLCGVLSACTTARGGVPLYSGAESVESVARQLDAAILSRDAVTLQQIVAPGFLQVLGDGSRADRALFIERLTAPGPTVDYVVSPRAIRMLGDSAVVTFSVDYPIADGAPGELRRAHVVDVYHRRGGVWRLEFEQLTVRRHGP